MDPSGVGLKVGKSAGDSTVEIQESNNSAQIGAVVENQVITSQILGWFSKYIQ